MTRPKNPEVNRKITKLIFDSGKTKTQLAQFLNVRVNTLRVWFVEGKFPLEYKQQLADFLECPIAVIEAIGFRFFGGDRPRYRFDSGQVSERNKAISEPIQYSTDNVVPLIVNLYALITPSAGSGKSAIKNLARDEFDYLAILEKQKGRHLTMSDIEQGLQKLKRRKQ